MNKARRLTLIFETLTNHAPPASADEARSLLEHTMNAVEDTHSGVPYCPDNWMSDGRMYPPADDFERRSPHPAVRVFRTRGHHVRFAANGAIRIVNAADGSIVFDLPGLDGLVSPY